MFILRSPARTAIYQSETRADDAIPFPRHLAILAPTGPSSTTTQTISTQDVAFWSQFYLLFDSASEVYSLLTLEDIRQTLATSPSNLLTLVTFLSAHLFDLLRSPLFPAKQTQSTLSSLIPSRPRSNSTSSNPTKDALNCLRVLGRILPVLYEVEGEGSEEGRRLVERTLWEQLDTPLDSCDEGEDDQQQDTDQFVIDDEDDEDTTAAAGRSEQAAPAKKAKPSKRPCLAERLFACIVDLMFCAGFTLPPDVGGEGGDKINYCIW